MRVSLALHKRLKKEIANTISEGSRKKERKERVSAEVASRRRERAKGRVADGKRGDQGTAVTKWDNKIKAIDRSVWPTYDIVSAGLSEIRSSINPDEKSFG